MGLSTTRVRAERAQNKSPSEYSNPYFRRATPGPAVANSNKEASQAGARCKNPDEKESDEEGNQEDTPGLLAAYRLRAGGQGAATPRRGTACRQKEM